MTLVFRQQSTHKRLRIAWLLLLVYVPMMIAVTFHHHGEAQRSDAAIHCQDCEHHVHHNGHILPFQHSMHDCVLCLLQNTPYLLPTVLLLTVCIVLCRIIRKPVCARRLLRSNDAKKSRAPPYLTF